MLTYETVKNIILDELRAKGYAPNPGDLTNMVNQIVEASKEAASSKPPKS